MNQNLTPATIFEIVSTQKSGRLACLFADQPYLIPVTYVFANGYVYGQTNEGAKLEFIRLNPNVCLEVSRIISQGKWQSVVLTGQFEELHGDDAAEARKLFLEKAFPIIEEYPSPENLPREVLFPENIRRVKQVIYRIKVISQEGYGGDWY